MPTTRSERAAPEASWRDVTIPAVYTLKEFIRAHRISRGKFYQLMKDGEGPDLMEVGARRFVTFEAAQRWREKLTKRSGR
jgi:hypothetical protein